MSQMSGIASIFDTPRAEPVSNEKQKNVPKKGSKKKNTSSKKELIDKIVQKEIRQLAESDGSYDISKMNVSVSKNKSLNSSAGLKKKAKASFKIKLQDAKKHKQKLRRSLQASANSKTAQNSLSESLMQASFNGNLLKDGSNHSSPTRVGAKKKRINKGKNKSTLMPFPIEFTPSKVKLEPLSPTKHQVQNNSSNSTDSVDIGRDKLSWILSPITVDDFMSNYWEKKPLLIQRNNSSYYKILLSRHMIDEMLRNNNIEYTKNIDITSYRENKRETHNPEGRVLPPDMWKFYGEGCSIRMLNPQTYLPSVYEMNVELQEYFHCMTGSNFYLTPPNSQGFAPHYDDIEAFVLQIEGQKHWKLYQHRDTSEVLARTSSLNFSQDEIGIPILEVVLQPGDLLYFPRGVIHQACTIPNHHSLHVTMSVYQKNSWTDLLDLFFQNALAQASNENVEFRRGIPIDLHQHFGIVYSDTTSTTRTELTQKIKDLVDKVFSKDAIDAAVDQLAKRFQHDALPPLLTDKELPLTVYGTHHSYNTKGTVTFLKNFTEKTNICLLRRNILRLVAEEDKLRIYYHSNNSREYHEYEPNFLELDQEGALGIEFLVKVYPKYSAIENLPVEDKVEFAKSLWEKGLIITN